MKYKDLNIHEKINVKSWAEHDGNVILKKCGVKGYINTLPFIILNEQLGKSMADTHRFYPCDKESLLFRENWKCIGGSKSLFSSYPYPYSAATAWLDNMI